MIHRDSRAFVAPMRAQITPYYPWPSSGALRPTPNPQSRADRTPVGDSLDTSLSILAEWSYVEPVTRPVLAKRCRSRAYRKEVLVVA